MNIFHFSVRSLVNLGLIALCLFVTACGPPWTVVKQTTPNQFVGQRDFVLEEVTFGDLEMEEAHIPAIAQGFDSSLRSRADGFKFAKSGGPDSIIIRPQATRVEKGISMGITSTDSEIDLRVQLVSGDEVLDEITLRAEHSQNDESSIGGIALGGYSDGDRLESAAKKLGRHVAKYLKKRTK